MRRAFIVFSTALLLLLAVIVTEQFTAGAPGPSASDSQAEGGRDLPVPVDLSRGGALVRAFRPKAGISCVSCHRFDSDARLVGPGLLHIGVSAGERVAGLSARDYIYQSIVNPGAYVVPGYADLMPKTWARVFTSEQLDQIVEYLLSLK